MNVDKITDQVIKMYTKLHKDSEFESKHKRDSDGKFAKKEGVKTVDNKKQKPDRYNEPFKEIYGLMGENDQPHIRAKCKEYADLADKKAEEFRLDSDPYERLFYEKLRYQLEDASESRDYDLDDSLGAAVNLLASKESADIIRNQYTECANNPTPEKIATIKDSVREYRKSTKNRINGILPDVDGVYYGDQIKPFADDEVVMNEVYDSIMMGLDYLPYSDDNIKPSGEQDWKMNIATKATYDSTDTIHRGTTNFELDNAVKTGYWGSSIPTDKDDDDTNKLRRAKFKFLCMSTSEITSQNYAQMYEGRLNTKQTVVLNFPKKDIEEYSHIVRYNGDVQMHADKEDDYDIDDEQTTYWGHDGEVRYDLDKMSTDKVKPICTVYSTKFREMEPEEKAEFEEKYKDLFMAVEYKEWSKDIEQYDL